MAASAVIAAVGLALAIGMTAKGLSDQAKAKKIMNNNPRPQIAINPEEDYNQKMAETFAGRGLSEETKQYYQQSSERGLTSSIDAILKGGGDSNDVSKSYGMYVDSIGRLAMADDQRRVENVNRLIDQNRRMSGEKDKLFQVNQYAPFADKAKEAAMLYGTGGQMISQGIQTGAGAVNLYAQGMKQRKDTKDVTDGVGDYASDMSMPQGNPQWPAASGNFPYNTSQTSSYTAQNFSRLTPEQQSTVGSLYWRQY